MPTDHVVVHVVAPAAPAVSVEDLDDAAIESLYDGPARAALDVLREGRRNGATRFVFVLPSIAATGAPGYSATCAATEAVRVLALSAARQWHEDGVTVNCLSAPWPYASSLENDIAPLVAFLGSDAAAGLSGETMRVGGPPVGL